MSYAIKKVEVEVESTDQPDNEPDCNYTKNPVDKINNRMLETIL